MLDITSLAIQEQTVLHLTHPVSGEKLYADEEQNSPITITIASTGTKTYRKAVTDMHNARLKRGKKQPTAEQQREEGIELLVACCITSDNLKYKGIIVKSESDFRALLSDDSVSWIKQQVDEALGDIERFIA